MPSSPLSDPADGPNPLQLAHQLLETQETALGVVTVPLYVLAEDRINSQEELLKVIVAALIGAATEHIAAQGEQLTEVLHELASTARAKVATQGAILSTVNGNQTAEGDFGYVIDCLESPCGPPPGGETRYCVIIWRDTEGNRWCFAICHQGFCPDVSGLNPVLYQCGWLSEQDARQAAQDSQWNPTECELPGVIPPPPQDDWTARVWEWADVNNPPRCGITCLTEQCPPWPQRPVTVIWNQGGYPSQASAQEALAFYEVDPECDPNEPPPIIPPGGQEPPRVVPPGYVDIGVSIPPPVDPNCVPYDPCYPSPLTLVERYVHTPPPLERIYWARARCVNRCQAIIECYTGDCPPAEEPGWTYWGPYYYCPTQAERDRIARACIILNSGGGGEPPGQVPPGVPEFVRPPPPPDRPPQPPPDPAQCPQPQAVRPQLQLDEYVPVCRTYEDWGGTVLQNLASYGSVDQINEALAEHVAEGIDDPYDDEEF